MQTSIEWLWKEIDNLIPYQNEKAAEKFYKLFEQAKEMHKQEIIEAYCQGCKDISEDDSIFPRETAEEYYKNLTTYNNLQ
jgi:hypothetical protein